MYLSGLAFTPTSDARAVPSPRHGLVFVAPGALADPCSSGKQRRARLRQGIPAPRVWLGRLLLGAALLGAVVAGAHASCGPLAASIVLAPQAPGVWSVHAQRGEANPDNRGFVANLLVVRDGARVWLIGSGPSPRFARALACRVRETVGRGVTDVVSPWPRPELVLGARAFGRARHWAHAEVAQAMRSQCADCVARLRQRLGVAAADLGARPARLPDHLLHGASGRLGPFDWWRVQRAPGITVTFWHVRGAALMTAQGLLWAGGLPDLRGSDLAHLLAATRQLRAIVAAAAPALRLLGEQGALTGLAQVDAHLHYWDALAAAIDAAQASGGDGTQTSQALPGVDAVQLSSLAHELNWQLAWRQAEDAAFAPQGAPRVQAPGRFQRNLR